MGCWNSPLGARSSVRDPGPQGLSQYYWASSPSYSLVLFKLLDRRPELRLIEVLQLSKVPLSGTLEELHLLLLCDLRVLCKEVTRVVEVRDHWPSERVELLFRLVGEALILFNRVPFLGQNLQPLGPA